MAKGRYTDQWEEGTEDGFLDDGAYDRYYGEDLSDDPMVADEKRPRKKLSKKEEREQARRQAEKEELKAEILAELQAERKSRRKRNRNDQGEELPEELAGDEVTAEEEKRPSRFVSFLMSFLSGNILSKQEVRKIYPYLLFIAFLAFVYIGNVFRMQHLYRKHERLTTEVKELRARSMTIASEKMRATRQSEIIREIERRNLPLKESLTPNKTIRR